MDWFPLFNSLRIAFFSTILTFFSGIFAAYYIVRLPRMAKGILDCVLTMPLVLPPTVIGFFLLQCFSPNSAFGAMLYAYSGQKILMTWYAAIAATTVMTFPLMYRTVRGAFEALDPSLIFAAKTLGLPNVYIFWRIILPNCKQGLMAGMILAFARGLGEYGATSMVSGYTPGRTATISTTVYQLWREGNEVLAYQWVGVNLLLSFIMLAFINNMEKKAHAAKR